jgi:glucokinase
MLLAGDIGGTKTNLALFNDNDAQPIVETTFKSGNYPSLETIAQEFLADNDTTVSKAVFGVAGPVVHGKSKITNLPWVMSETSLSKTLNIPKVKLLNDLEAIGHAVLHLPAENFVPLNDPQVEISGNKAIVAPGTGLGEAVLFAQTDDRYYVLASEGGHTDFAPKDATQLEMLRYLQTKFNNISYERVCSGSGVPNIYDALKHLGIAPENPGLTTAISQVADPTPTIIQAGLAGSCELCEETLNMFVSILGAEAGNLALKVMATGGVYLGGGIPPRIIDKLKNGTFMTAFTNKGRMAEILFQIPVYVILNTKAPLLGAAFYGKEL